MSAEQAGFKVSMLGFRKADVLACIDRMSAEHQDAQTQAAEQMKTLEEMLAALRTEKDALALKEEEQSAEMQTMQDAIIQQHSLVLQAQDKAQALEEELLQVKEQAHEYQTRLFAREGEVTALRRDSAQLNETVLSQKAALECLTQEEQSIRQQATLEIQAANTQADYQVQQEKNRLHHENELLRGKMKESASDMAQEIVVLKDALTALDEKIESSLFDLQRSTNALSKTLEATEQNVERLGIKLEHFPDRTNLSGYKQTPQSASQTNHQQRTASSVSCKGKAYTISSLLLTKIGKMIGEL